MKAFLRLLKYLRPYKPQVFLAFLCMLVVAITNILLIPLVSFLSQAIGGKDLGLLNLVIVAALIIYFFKGLATYGQGYLMHFAAHRVVTDLRITIFKHLQDLSIDFYSKWRTGDLVSRLINDITTIEMIIVQSIVEIVPSFVTLVGVLGYIFYLNWRLTLLTLLVMPLISFLISRFGREMRKVSHKAQRKAADVASVLQEFLHGVRIIKSFATESYEIEKFRKEAEQNFWSRMKESQIKATQTPVLAFIQMLAVVMVVWYGGYEVISGRLSAPNLIAFFAGIALIADPLSKLGVLSTLIQSALASAERVFEIIDIKPTIKEKENAKELKDVKGTVEFKNVTFQYEKDEPPVLKDVNIKAHPGEIIALVGRSGAGKSTLVNLIPRFYDPEQGAVLIDGNDVKDLTLNSLRGSLGIVPQETILFTGTVKENIAYAKTDASLEEIEKVAKMANAHDFIIKLPQGYETLVGEKGVRLSGGERQRISIARALLRDPKILIFDEATSALDSESERLVQEAMNRLMQGRTTFIIAHRLSTVQHATNILVLDQGRIAEQGKHRDLLSKSGLYKKLYEMQFKDE